MMESRANPSTRLAAVSAPRMPAERSIEGGVDTRGGFMITSASMPNIRAAAKRVRADVKRRDRNLEAKSKLKTMVRQFTHSIEEKQADQAKKIYPLLTR